MRTRAAATRAEQCLPDPADRRLHVCLGAAGANRDVVPRLRHVEQVPAEEFAVRIVRGVASLFEAERAPGDVDVAADERTHLFITPDIEGSLRLARAGCLVQARRNAVGILCRIEP